MTIATITAGDDLLSMYGINKTLACLRDHNDGRHAHAACAGRETAVTQT